MGVGSLESNDEVIIYASYAPSKFYFFYQEIVGGMIDSDHRLWRKPPKENFDEQRKKVLKFAEMWKPYDWTQNISKNVNGDSSSSDSD